MFYQICDHNYFVVSSPSIITIKHGVFRNWHTSTTDIIILTILYLIPIYIYSTTSYTTSFLGCSQAAKTISISRLRLLVPSKEKEKLNWPITFAILGDVSAYLVFDWSLRISVFPRWDKQPEIDCKDIGAVHWLCNSKQSSATWLTIQPSP